MRQLIRLAGSLLLLTALLVACQSEGAVVATPAAPTAAAVAVTLPEEPTPTPAAEAEPGKHLTICMAEEPSTLYWHARSTLYEEAALHALFENDIVGYAYFPDIMHRSGIRNVFDLFFGKVHLLRNNRTITAHT